MYIRCFFKKLLARCLTVHNTSLEKSFYRGGQISLYAPYVLLAHPIGHAKNTWSKAKCLSNRDTTRNLSFCSLLAKPNLELSF